MTRENKLALVVGFGLILFVGILISDHFAPSPNRSSAELGDPALAAGGPRERMLTELNPRPPVAVGHTSRDNGGMPGSEPEQGDRRRVRGGGPGQRDDVASGDPGQGAGPGPGLRDGIRVPGETVPTPPGGLPPGPGGDVPRQRPEPGGERHYLVKEGDTLYGIARRVLGDPSLWPQLRDLNGLKEREPLRVGTRLLLPAPAGLGEVSRASLNEARDGTERPAPPREYVVREGDTLSIIAERLLGKRSRWQELYDLNRGRVKDPNQLVPGTRLALPTGGRNGTRA